MKFRKGKKIKVKKIRTKPRVDMRRGVLLLPNLLTTANLFCGFLSIVQSLKGHYATAGWLVVLAMFFDFLDGRVARMTGCSSDFGCEYDSLSDIVTFVVSPTILVYLFGLKNYGKIGIAAGFLFLACGALRLARYNVQSADVEKNDFQGLPTPSGGGVLCTFVIFYLHMFGHADKYLFVLVPLTIAMGLLMVSAVRYKGFKRLERTSFVSMIFLVALVFVMAMEPQIMFFAFGVVYVSIGIVQWFLKTPHKIGGVRDLWNRFYEARHEDLISDDDELNEERSVSEATADEPKNSITDEQPNGSETAKVINFSK